MSTNKPTNPPKFPDAPELPDTKELIEPLRKLLDYLEYDLNGDWNEAPQYVALENLLSQYPRVGQAFLWHAEAALAEKKFGPCPQFERAAHPHCAELTVAITALEELAEKGGGHNDELRYQQARTRLLEDPEVAARVPASLKVATSLRAFKEQINLVMGDCTDENIKGDVIRQEFGNLGVWLEGAIVHGSPEWIAQNAWLVKTRLQETYFTMITTRQIHDAVVARVPAQVRRQHWIQFVESELQTEPSTAHALLIAEQAWDPVFSNNLVEKQKKSVPEAKEPPIKRKSSKRLPRR